MLIKFFNVEIKSDSVWIANFNRKALENIDKSIRCKKEDLMFNIVTFGKVNFSVPEKTIEIESEVSEFISLGLVIRNKVLIEKKDGVKSCSIQNNKSDDLKNKGILFDLSGEAKFKRDLLNQDEYLNRLGLELLNQVRIFHPQGSLKYHPRTKVFVEKPSNFWAIRIHPKTKELQIIVRGPIEVFKALNTRFEIKRDQASYCKVYVSNLNQITDAIKIIKKAKWY